MMTFCCLCSVRELLLLAFACILRSADGQPQQQPNILFVVMDDLGFADLGLHGSGIQTPTSDQLANDGLYLNNYYVLPTCTTTRIALMTGRFPYRMGQYEVVRQSSKYGLPLDEETMAQMLRRAGYQTHAVGKWHLGHSKYEQTPTFRGFESFFGFYHAGALDYFYHTKEGLYDMRYDQQEFCGSGCSEIVDERGNYSSFIYSREAARVVNEHDESNGPLFLYLAFQAVHFPLQVPQEYVDLYSDNSDFNSNRKTYAGMLTAADEALGQVVDALIEKGLWSNSLLVYTTDNGGQPTASNAPLQGGKKDVWEGGVAGEGFLSGPALASLGMQTLTSTDEIFHAVDWLPTLASIANVSPTADKPLDGVDQFATLQGNEVARQDIFLGYSVGAENEYGSLGSLGSYTAFRSKQFKLVRSQNREDFFLYNLQSDREEQNDIAADKPNRVQTMKRKMEELEAFFVDVDTGDETCPNFGEVSWENTTWNQPFLEPWCSAL